MFFNNNVSRTLKDGLITNSTSEQTQFVFKGLKDVSLVLKDVGFNTAA